MSVTIILNNSTCEVKGADRKTLNGLKEALSYVNQNADYAYSKHLKNLAKLKKLFEREKNPNIKKAYQGRMNQTRFNLNKAKEERKVSLLDGTIFPSGLLNTALDYLDEMRIYWEIEEQRVKPKGESKPKLTKPLYELRHYQQESVDKILQHERGIVENATGTGKTLILSKVAAEMEVPTLILTPNTNINMNAYDTLVTFFGDKQVTKLTNKTKKLNKINVCNIQTFVKLDPELCHGLGAVIIDEFHRSGAENYVKVNLDHLKNCYWKVGLTATNFRNGGDDMALIGVLSDVIYQYSAKQALKEKYLTPVKFKWISNINKVSGNYQQQYKTGIVENDERNEQIAEIVKKNPDRHILVLVQNIEHGTRLFDLIPDSEFISGKEKDEERTRMLDGFRAGKIKVLIGTSVIGEGVDLPIADMVILGGGGKAKSQVIQNVGRVMRLYPGKKEALVYDFMDQGPKGKNKAKNYLEEHAIERLTIYKEIYGDN